MDEQTAGRIRSDPQFLNLVQTRLRFGWTLAIIMLVIYYGFIFIVAFAPGLMGARFIGSVTLGFPLGLGVILAAILLTGVYVWRANGQFDDMNRRIVERFR